MKRRQEEPWQSKLGSGPFNPLEVDDLQEAIRNEQTEISLSGRVFLLLYLPGDRVYYRLKDSMSPPCGYLETKKFLQGF